MKIRTRLRRLIIESLDERIPLAADAEMIKDINALTTTFISSPKNFTTIGNTTFFSASTETYGTELWKTDGTPNGTNRVKDIRPGNGNSIGGAFTNFNNTLYFTANDGVNGAELWKSDGTEAGTVLVKEINNLSSGSNPDNLHRADIVLVGGSRTSKTPLSIYLSHKGWKVANLPLVRGIEPPKFLYEIDQKKIVGLTIDPEALAKIRRERLVRMGREPTGDYASLQSIREEIEWAREIFSRNRRWPIFDVTNKALEETASEIEKRFSKA
jgi:ELWxxDGT repeat protein